MDRLTFSTAEYGAGIWEEPKLTCKEICESHQCEDCPIQACFNKLADYEDAEEQGRLVKLPCKIGDTIYYITSICDFTFKYCQTPFRDCSECEEGNKIIAESKFDFRHLKYDKAELRDGFFLTREEAEAKLKEMEN